MTRIEHSPETTDRRPQIIHAINNCLTIIASHAELIRRAAGGASASSVNSSLKAITKHVEKIRRLLDPNDL